MAVHQVSHRATQLIDSASRSFGIPLDELVDGTGIPAETVRRHQSLHWDDFITLVEGLVSRVGEDRMAELCARPPELAPEAVTLFSMFLSPVRLYRFINEKMGPSMYPMFQSEHDVRPDGTLELRLDLRPGHRRSALFFRLNARSQAAIPTFIGLPESEIEATCRPDGAVYVITPPASATLLARGERGFRSAFAETVVESMEREFSRLLSSFDALRKKPELRYDGPDDLRLDEAVAFWGLTRRQAQVARGLVQGMTNQGLAQQLGCSVKTIETHMTALMRRMGVTSRLAVVAKLRGN